MFAAADVLGHQDLKMPRIYQHPELDAIRRAIDERSPEGDVRVSPTKSPTIKKQGPPGREGTC